MAISQRGTNAQLDRDGNFIEAVATVSKETLAAFPVKKLIEARKGVQTWIVSLVTTEQALKIRPPRQRHHGGDQSYLTD